MQDLLTAPWLPLVAAPLGALLTFAACHWGHARQRRGLEQRVKKLSSDRDALRDQVKGARVQIATLQRDLATWRMASPAGKAGPSSMADGLPPPVTAQPEIPRGLVFESPQAAALAFADTRPFDDAESVGAPPARAS